MTTRSIVLSTAAFVLFAAAGPAPFGFAPTTVLAQNLDAEVRAALAGDPAGLSKNQLRRHIDALRQAIDAGAVDERQARVKMRAYAEALRAQRDGGQKQQAEPDAERANKAAERQRRQKEKQAEQARRQQEKQAEKARRQQEKQAEQARRQQEKQAEQARRQQERQAERERQRQQERQAERQRQQEQQAEQERRQQERQAERERQRQQERQAERQRQQEQQAQQRERRQTAAQVAGDNRPSSALDEEELRQRFQRLRDAIDEGVLTGDEVPPARRQMRADGEELKNRRAGRQRQQEQQAQQRERRQTAAQVAGDNRPSSALEVQELRQRFQRLRDAIDEGVLTGEEVPPARRQMRADGEELRNRLAERQRAEEQQRERPRQARERTDDAPRGEVASRAQELLNDDTPARRLRDGALRRRLEETRSLLATGRLSRDQERALRQRLRDDREEMRGRRSEQASADGRSRRPSRSETTINIDVILDQRRPSDRLSEEELEWRVHALQQALREERMARRDAEIARHIVEQDRRELRHRLRNQRERRREALYRARDRDELNIDFHVGYRPPPVIYAAEAAMEEIEVQLVAPPLYQTPRAYSFQEIATNHEVRQAMPGIEVDTLNFDFGSAEVRPEEIDKLDTIAEVIERIVAARPDEVFLIEGHTDAVGSDAANLGLSRARAAAVEEALIYYYAIDPANLRTVGLGEHFLRIPTPEPEEENRRVTVRRITPLLAGRG